VLSYSSLLQWSVIFHYYCAQSFLVIAHVVACGSVGEAHGWEVAHGLVAGADGHGWSPGLVGGWTVESRWWTSLGWWTPMVQLTDRARHVPPCVPAGLGPMWLGPARPTDWAMSHPKRVTFPPHALGPVSVILENGRQNFENDWAILQNGWAL
jgi:hypothetical protein